MTIVSEIPWEAVADPGFGSGREAWRQAIAQIAAKAKEKLPACNGRIERAVALVLAGDVQLNDDGSATIGSAQHPDRHYTVANGTCPCKDYPRAPHHFCQHRLGAAIARRAIALTSDQASDQPAPAAPAPSQAATAATIPLPEAPASANCYVTIAGRQVQVTLRDTDETRLLARLTALLAQYPLPEAPSTALPEGWCALHQMQMPLNEKEGRTWYSHRTDEGTWCRGKARRRA